MKWTCELCGKKLSSKRSYDEHFNVHTNLRPFACKHCGYAAGRCTFSKSKKIEITENQITETPVKNKCIASEIFRFSTYDIEKLS